MGKYIFFLTILLGLSYTDAFAQQEPCNTGGEPSCTCSTAPALCNIGQLNGYSYSMSTTEPSTNNSPPLGNGTLCNVSGTQVNNPTWFSFLAWCTNLTLIAHISNCIDNPNRAGISLGVQAAVFSNCSANSCIAQDVSTGGTGCTSSTSNPPRDRILNLSGLTVGGRYYFLVDGCAGSACDVSIEVVGDCSLTVGDILPVQGPDKVCGSATGTFTIPAVQGAALYHWTLNGTPIGGTTRTVTTTFPGPGIYTLCVDISNPPCLLQSDNPAPVCTQIEVLGESAEAGTLSVVTSPACPGQTINFSVSGYNTNTMLFTEKLLITNAAGTILEILNGTSGSYTSNVCATYRVYSYNYSAAPNSIQPAIGLNANTLLCTNCFCDIEFLTLVFADTQPPVFANLPGSVSVVCFEDIPPPENLNWTDNCAPAGVALPSISQNYTQCQGGTITRTWTATDLCNNTASHTQTITVAPVPAATFTPYPDVVIQCSEINTFDYTKVLVYDNSRIGQCAIMGSIPAVRDNSNYMNCQGTIRLTWSATDFCGRAIFDDQIITVNPPPVATYVNVPNYSPILCEDAISYFAPTLDYTNSSATCPIAGTANPLQIPNYSACGGTINVSWSATDDCQRLITASRTLNILPAAPPQITDALPQNVTVECGPVEGFNIALNYSNGSSGQCLIGGTLLPNLTQNFNACGGTAQVAWNVNANCGTNLNHIQNIAVNPAPPAAFINLPPDLITVSCSMVPVAPPLLQYSNGITGTCGINGSVPGTVSGTYNRCGGTLTYNWVFTDACSRSINYSQTVLVEPATDAYFANLPTPTVQLPCNTNYPNPPSLIYSNTLTGACAINGTVLPTFVDLGDHRVYTWTFQNPCSLTEQTVTQEVYLSPSPTISISPVEDEICNGDFYDLSTITLTLGGGTSFDIKYFRGTTPSPANEIFSPIVNPSTTTSYTIRAINEFGCTKDAVFVIKVITNNQAGTGQSVPFCNNGDLTINFFRYLTNVTDFTGSWTDELNSGVNLNDPYNVRFLNIPDGVYRYIYTVPSPNACPEIPSTLIIRLVKPPSYKILGISCSSDLQSYNITLLASEYTVTGTKGTVMAGKPDTVYVKNIPAGQNVVLNLKSKVVGCGDVTVPVTAPDCNCPFIPAPTSGGDKTVCFGDPIPDLVVSLSPNQIARWYDEETEGTLLASSNGNFKPIISNPGNFIYYVESFDTISKCPSTIRISVSLNVVPLLSLKKDTFQLCDDNYDNKLDFLLTAIKNSFYKTNSLQSFLKYEFYNTLADAQAGQNNIVASTFPVTGSGEIFIAVTNADNCQTISSSTLVVDPKPKLTFTTTDVVCFGESNGAAFFVLGNSELLKFSNGSPGTLANFNNLKAGNYPAIVTNEYTCTDSTSVIIKDGLKIDFANFEIKCNNNNTLLNKTDDFYEISIRLSSSSASNVDFDVFYKNNKIGTYTYGTLIPIILPADGSTGDILVKDKLTGCSIFRPIGPLESCSFPCSVFITGLVSEPCDNNQTNNDESDDTFNLSFMGNITGLPGTSFDVFIDGVASGSFAYNTKVTLKLKADGISKKIELIDKSNAECINIFNVEKPSCSKCVQTVSAGTTSVINCQQNTVTLNGSSSAPGNFVWTGPGNFNKTGNPVTTSTPGTYYLTVSFPDKCVITDSVKVVRDASVPIASGGPDKNLNCFVTEVTLTGTSNLTADIELRWTNSAGTLLGSGYSIMVTDPGSYYFEVINLKNNCNSGKDEVIVTQNILKPDATISADPGKILDCIIGTITLSGKQVPNVIFNWQTGEAFINNQRSIVINSNGLVTMTAIDTLNGCRSLSTIDIVDIKGYPILLTDPAAPITCINNGTKISAAKSQKGPNLVYQWYGPDNKAIPGANKDTLYVILPGKYYVVLTDTFNKCTKKDSVLVNRLGEYPVVTLPKDITLFCGNDKTSINANIQNPSSAFTVAWNTTGGTVTSTSNTQNVSVQGEGVYSINVTYNNSGCRSTESIRVITDRDFPKAIATNINNETCKGQKDGSVNVGFVTGGPPPYQYRLNGSPLASVPIYNKLAPGNYTLQVTDANGCKYDTIIVVQPGVDINLKSTSPIELGYKQSKIIEIVTNLKPEEIASIVWTPSDFLSCDSCLVTTMSAREDITYTVKVTDINGCNESLKISVRVKENIIITTPNIINIGGSSNKYFTVYGNESVINIEKLSIYDRWGNLVFLKNNFLPNIPDEGWDGKFDGREVVPGVYVFIVEYLAPSGKKILTGDVTITK